MPWSSQVFFPDGASMYSVLLTSHAQQQSHAREHPLGRSLSAFEVKCPDVGVCSQLGLVDGTLVDVARFLPVVRDGTHRDYRHAGSEFF